MQLHFGSSSFFRQIHESVFINQHPSLPRTQSSLTSPQAFLTIETIFVLMSGKYRQRRHFIIISSFWSAVQQASKLPFSICSLNLRSLRSYWSYRIQGLDQRALYISFLCRIKIEYLRASSYQWGKRYVIIYLCCWHSRSSRPANYCHISSSPFSNSISMLHLTILSASVGWMIPCTKYSHLMDFSLPCRKIAIYIFYYWDMLLFRKMGKMFSTRQLREFLRVDTVRVLRGVYYMLRMQREIILRGYFYSFQIGLHPASCLEMKLQSSPLMLSVPATIKYSSLLCI